ncbi:hypothetical protein AVEN_8867-1 [Araneus ventricosus]|uniref:Uncharacterized protein n=1 Tax=Araneus ventricosus TaxID=182803 RepID=A0A4Y2HEP8_ARAVE|nr:hypothetical protein AVEN_8867-1 [Araneus ventricosus]
MGNIRKHFVGLSKVLKKECREPEILHLICCYLAHWLIRDKQLQSQFQYKCWLQSFHSLPNGKSFAEFYCSKRTLQKHYHLSIPLHAAERLLGLWLTYLTTNAVSGKISVIVTKVLGGSGGQVASPRYRRVPGSKLDSTKYSPSMRSMNAESFVMAKRPTFGVTQTFREGAAQVSSSSSLRC